MTNEKPKNMSEHEFMAIELLKQLVPDQKSTYEDGEGRKWSSYCKQVENMAITIISKQGRVVARVVYDYDSGEEQVFYGGDSQ